MAYKGISIKESAVSERRVCQVWTLKSVLQMQTSALFGAKKLKFSKFIVCFAWTRRSRFSQSKYFADKGVNFSQISLWMTSILAGSRRAF